MSKQLYMPDGEDADYSKYRGYWYGAVKTSGSSSDRKVACLFTTTLDQLKVTLYREATVHHSLDDMILWVERSNLYSKG